MFNKFESHHHSHTQAPAYPQHIHEHRAPTTESVKLYREIEEEVCRNIITKGKTTNPMFECRWFAWDNPKTRKISVYGKLTFNGGEHEIKGEFDEFDVKISEKDIYKFLYDTILKELSYYLTMELFKQDTDIPFERFIKH